MGKVNKNESGFSAIEILIVVVVLGLMVAVGWLVWDRQKSESNDKSTTSQTEKVVQKDDSPVVSASSNKIKFESEESFDSIEKQKIVSQFAEPLLFYHEEVLKIKLKEVVIKKNTEKANDSDGRYVLSYPYEKDPTNNNFSFVFGNNNKLEYWQPLLCDDGGCDEYPTSLKNKFPKNYDAYVECKAANNASDKEKANELGCFIP